VTHIRIRTPFTIAAVAIAAVAIAVAALAGTLARAAVVAHPARGSTVRLESTSLGKILANGSGDTLYLFTHDKRKHDSCVGISGCASAWPPLTTRGAPSAGAGVKRSLLGTISIGHGRKQVTYAGHPLYTYAGDSPGDTSYVGVSAFGGTWDAVTAAGKGRS
jgi:predicted lipoprotein with Yx(FWY)xxD motif